MLPICFSIYSLIFFAAFQLFAIFSSGSPARGFGAAAEAHAQFLDCIGTSEKFEARSSKAENSKGKLEKFIEVPRS